MSFTIGDELELTIDRLSYDGGRGVGRVDGFVIFVADTAPNERVLVQITQIKKNFAEANLVKILKPSAARRSPPCPIASRCGGCAWQHVVYDEQLHQKQQILNHQLKSVLPSEIKIKPIIASPNEFRYRNRVQIHLELNENNKPPIFGFFAKETNSVVATNDCLISDERLFSNLVNDDDFIAATKQITQQKRHQKRGSHDASSSKIELALNENNTRVIRPLNLTESEFTQVNTSLNSLLKQHVVDRLRTEPPLKNIYDLYCGAGNLSFPIIDTFPESNFTGVELNTNACERAKTKLAGYPTRNNVLFVASAVHKFLKRLKKLNPHTAIVLDPPRAGLEGGVIDQLLRLRPELIIYVSCSLPTLARDLKKFQNYSVSSVQGFDMFPQTEYLETVVALSADK